jgi:hypothetical protein
VSERRSRCRRQVEDRTPPGFEVLPVAIADIDTCLELLRGIEGSG